MRREPEVPEEKVPEVECLDGPARITSKELAPIHSVKNGTLQNACSTRPRAVADLRKSALTHIVRLMSNLVKNPKRMMTKSAVAMLKVHELHDRTGQPVVNRDESHERTGQPVVKRDTRHELKHGPVGCRSSNTRQLGCVFQDMEPPKLSPILRKSSDLQKPIQRVKFTKAIARHTKIRDQNPSLGYICPGDLISAAPTLQNLRIVHAKRQNGKSKVPAKQRGGWLKVCKNKRRKTEQHSSHLRKIGACLHQR